MGVISQWPANEFCAKDLADSRCRRKQKKRLILVEKFVVEDGGCQHKAIFGGVRLLGTNQPSLTKNAAVFLPGNLFGHFKDHFYQRVGGKLLRSVEQQAGLADV